MTDFYCDDCSYCLRGLPPYNRCPECGGTRRRLGAKRRRPGVKWVILGLLCAIGWGYFAPTFWRSIRHSFESTAGVSSGSWEFHTPNSGEYASIHFEAKAITETDSNWLPDTLTTEYSITITPIPSRSLPDVIVSGDIESIRVETVLEAMRRAGAADVTPMLRAEAEYVWKLIASRYDAIRAPDTPVPRVALTESAIWGVGTSSMRTSTHVPRVFTALAWVAFVTGWLVIALLTWRSVVAARERSATSLNPLQFDQ